MKSWEIDVELRVRKTLTFAGPNNEAAARSIAAMALTGAMDPSTFIKWTDGRTAYRAVPVEEWIDNNPQIVGVRQVADA